MSSVFLDTNFFLDLLDAGRRRYPEAKELLELFVAGNTPLYTSSDIISTVSYFLQKRLNIKQAVTHIDLIVRHVTILTADNEDFVRLNTLLLEALEAQDEMTIDYEDCMQLFLANKHNVANLLTSDQRFCKGVSEKFPVRIVTLEEMVARYKELQGAAS